MWHDKIVASWRLRCDNAFKHAAFEVEKIVELLAWVRFPGLQNLILELIQIEIAYARQAAVE